PDHVDAHRSTCYVISPWIKRGSIDHSFQNTVSVIKTMELLLGLPPMCQYDAVASPILDWDEAANNGRPYEAILPPKKWIADLNPHINPKKQVSPEQPKALRDADALEAMGRASEAMDFSQADQAPAHELNQIIWKSIKGVESEMPRTPHGPEGATPRAKDSDD